MPGTIVDVVLAPTAVPRTLLTSDAVDELPTVLAVAPLRHIAGRAEATRVMETVRDAPTDCSTAVSVLTWEVPEDVDERYPLGCHVLDLADGIADHARLVLLTPGLSARRLSAALREVDDLRAERGHHAGVPVMVLDEKGTVAWLGVSSATRRLLAAVAESPNGIQRERIPKIVGRAPSATESLLGTLDRWLVSDGGMIRLRVTPSALVHEVRGHLATRIGNASFATTKEADAGTLLVTPTLATVDKWLDARRIVRHLGGARLTGHLLGLETARRVGPVAADDDLSVAFVGRVPPEARAAFVAAVGAHGRQFELSGEVGLIDDPGAPFVRADTSIVCLTDVMVTATHVRHALHDLVRAGARPRAVACFVDGRTDAHNLTALGRSIPVTSAVRIPLGSKRGSHKLEPIQPISVPAGFAAPPEPPAPPIGAPKVLEWGREIDGVLLTGHVARLARRHFSSLLEVAPLLADTSVRRRVRGEVRELLEQWLATKDSEAIVLLRPGGVSDRSKLFAELVEEALEESPSAPPTQQVFAIERVVRAGRNVLAVPQDRLAPKTTALVVDWGAVTLNTTQELIHIAADLGASAVLAVIFSSQLAPPDELAASHVRAVSGREPDSSRAVGQLPLTTQSGQVRSVPAEIRLVTSFAVGYAAAAECQTCGLVREYTQVAGDAPSPDLAAHARATAELLEPVDLVVARQEGPRDAFRGSIPKSQAADIIAMRHELAAAQLATDVRLRLVDSLPQLRPDELDTLVMTLALEPRWLKLPPLRFALSRHALSEALMRRMTGSRFSEVRETLRRQYAVVLRATSKARFLRNFDRLLAEAVGRNDMLVANDLLLGIYTLTSRPYHRDQHAREQQTDALVRAAARLRSTEANAVRENALEVGGGIRNMLARIDYADSRERDADLSTREAWLRLREDYWHTISSHEHDLPIRSISAALLLPRTRTAGSWESDVDDFGRIQRFLAKQVLPRLGPVSDVLVNWFRDRDDEQLPLLRRLLRPNGLDALTELGEAFNAFAKDPELAHVRRDEVSAALWQWWEFFFTRERDGRAADGLLTAIGECPCDVGEAFVHGVTTAASVAERPVNITAIHWTGSDFSGFCHPRVVSAIGHHLLVNATQVKHAAQGVENTVRVEVRIAAGDHDVRITMLNNGTAEAADGGQGLATLRRRLSPYGGRLETIRVNEPWTYGISTVIPRPWELR